MATATPPIPPRPQSVRPALSRLRVSTFGGDDETVVRLSGSLDTYTAVRARRALARHHGSDGAIELDLSGLRLIDSTGLRMVVALARDAATRGRRLRVVASDAVAPALAIGGVPFERSGPPTG